MILDRLRAFFSGTLVIKVRGADLEEFINAASRDGITLRSVKRHGRYLLTCRVAMSDYRKLRRLLPQQRFRSEIVGKHGFPVTMRRIRSRRMLILGLAAAVGLLYYMSSFVWFIRVTGNEALPEDAIRQFIESRGVRRGIRKFEIDADELEKELAIEFPRISWVAVRLQGTLLSIDLAEKLTPTPEESKALDVVAAKSGLIVTFIPLVGVPLIREGDTVEAGQVLVRAQAASGYMDGTSGASDSAEVINARAVVEARVWYQASAQVKLLDTEVVRTGRVKTTRKLHVFGLSIPLGIPGKGFAHSECEERSDMILLWPGSRIGLNTTVVTCHETALYPVVRTLEQARTEAIRNARTQALEKVPEGVEVVDEIATVSVSGEGENAVVHVEFTVETIEDIGVLRASQGDDSLFPNP